MFDVCVIGHVTKDVIKANGKIRREIPGGTAYYTSMTLRSLGLDVAVITKVAQQDQDYLLNELKGSGITVFCQTSDQTTTFENMYLAEDMDVRVQRVTAIAPPFSPSDMPSISAAICHVGPLTSADVSLELLKALSPKANLISLDVQGLVRRVINGEVMETDWQDKTEGLGYVDILKANEHEARILSGEDDVEKAVVGLSSFGPKEIIITRAGRGSVIFARGTITKIPPVPPRKVVDATGCGDTYVAGYLYQRLLARDIATAGRFAAMIATAKLERFGAFSGRGKELP
jgi:sugar/nucleoside kinase (ribokinase family)